MIVYHGSSIAVEHPDTTHSYRNLDFGAGFYVTSVRMQAERWAKRKADLLGHATGVVSTFDLSDVPLSLNICDFGNDLDQWIDFVCECREGNTCYLSYDIIMGKVANDKIYRVVDMYRRGIWDKSRAIKEMKVYETYDQIAFISQQAIDRCLTFSECYEVKIDD